jgi:hypothetical protein
VLGNGPRRANGLGPWIPKQRRTFDVPACDPLTKPSSCEACSAFTRVAACTLRCHQFGDTLIEGFSHFVTSMPAPVASGGNDRRVGLAPTGNAPPCHGAHPFRTFALWAYERETPEGFARPPLRRATMCPGIWLTSGSACSY